MKNLLRFKYVILVMATLAIVSCASTNNRKCNGTRGHRVPMGVL